MKFKYILIIFLLLVSCVSGVIVSDGVTEDIPIDKGISASTLYAFDTRFTDDDIDSFMDTTVKFQGKDYDVHDELLITTDSPSIETSLTSLDDDYESNVFMEVTEESIYYLLFSDEGTLNISKATSTEPFEVDFLGKKLKIIDVPDGYNDRFTAIVGDRYYMYTNDVININDKQITLVNVGSGGQIEVDVDGYQDMIPAASTKFVNGIEIYLETTFYDSITENRAAILYIGNPAIKTYIDGDAFIGEDLADPKWVWDIVNLGNTGQTTVTVGTTVSVTSGPVIGIHNEFEALSDQDEVLGIGECWDLPNNYASICLDSLTVSDDDYLPVTIEYIDNVDLSDVGLSTTEKVIYIHASGDDRFTLVRDGELSDGYGEYFMDVGDVVIINDKPVTLVNVGSGGSVIVDVDGTVDTIPAAATEIVNEIEITVVETFYASFKSERAAILAMGDTVIVPPEYNVDTSEVWLTMLGEELGIFYRDNEQIPSIVHFGNLDVSTEKEFLRVNYQDTKDDNIMFKAIKGSEEVEIPNPLDPLPEGVYYINQIHTRFFVQIKLDINGDSSLELSDEADDLITTWLIEHEFIGNETAPPFNFDFVSLGLEKDLAEVNEVVWSHKYINWEGVETLDLVGIGKKDEDHRSKDHRSIYGIIVKDPKSNGASDKVVLQIPGDQVQANVVVKGKTVPKIIPEPEEPSLKVGILNPIDSSVINTNSVWLNVNTCRNTICEYSLGHGIIIPAPPCEEGEPCQPGVGSAGASKPKKMSVTDGTSHSQLITGLENTINDGTQEEWYSIHVTCTDSSNKVGSNSIIFTVDVTKEGITDYIHLNTGWNLFSIPLTMPLVELSEDKPEEKPIDIRINDIKDKVEAIYAYEQGQWKVWRPAPHVNTLTNLEAGKGYWIKLTGPAVLHVEGTISDGLTIPTFNVYQGWNLIGYYGTIDIQASSALRNIDGKYSAIWTLFDNNLQTLQGTFRGLEFSQELKRTHGYWLYMQEDGIIVPTN